MAFQTPSTQDYLPALTGVRALAAFWVLLYHLHPALHAYYGSDGLWMAFVNGGYQGVDLFFVLSGFIIAHHYAARLHDFSWTHYRDYLWARIARIYPLHLVMLLTVLAMVKFAPVFGFSINRATDYEWVDFIKNLFLVQAWGFPAHVNWNHFAWSISAEWFAYLLAPVFVALIWARKRIFFQLYLMALFLCIAPVAVMILGEPSPSAYALFRIVGGFGAGMVAYQIFQSGRWQKLNWNIRTWIGLVALIAAAIMQELFISGTDFLTVPFAVMFVFALAHQQGKIAALLSTSAFDYAGRISYALYLTQFVLLMPLRKILPYQAFIHEPIGLQLSYLGGLCIAAIAMACLGYHLVEEPARRFLRRQ